MDVGGTFTDGVVVDEEGRLQVFKTPTTPGDPSQGFLECLRKAADAVGKPLERFLSSVNKLAYGTTLATNLLVEQRGVKVGLVTTEGFGDTLEIARIGREYLPFDLQFDKPQPLVPRRRIMEVAERVDADGNVICPLSEQSLLRAVKYLVEVEGIESLAIGFLWSFRYPQHELLARDIITRHWPNLWVTLSHEVAPILGEYERFATTVTNAALGPPISQHLASLTKRLQELGFNRPLLLMQSNGGLESSSHASQKPVNLISSGPAGGVLATQRVVQQLTEVSDVICFDMGGTTCDVALIINGEPFRSLLARRTFHALAVSMLEVSSIGAGGGSIAWVDFGRLKVGPQSAGAVPGPACYGRGGERPTVTDADVYLVDPFERVNFL